MRISILLAVLLLVGILPLFSQKEPMKFGDIPPEDLAMKTYPPDTSAAAVVLGDFGSVSFKIIGDDFGYVFNRHRRIKILRRAGFDEGDIVIPFYNKDRLEKVEGLKAHVITPDGKKTEVPKSEIFEEEINRSWSSKRFSCPNLTEGAIIEYKYVVESKAIFQLPEWKFQEEIPVRWSELRLAIPEFYDYVFLTQGRQADISEHDETRDNFYVPGDATSSGGSFDAKVTLGRYVMKDVPGLKEEAYITTMDDYYARMRFQLSSVKFPNGPLRPIMSTWPKVAEELLDRPDFGGQFLKKKNYDVVWSAAQSSLAGASAPEEKIAALYKWINETFTLETMRGIYVSKSLNDCFEKKNGRAGELNLLMVALLKEAGIEAYPALTSTRSNGQLQPLYPILDQFDHVLAVAKVGEKSLFIDLGNACRPIGCPAVNSLNGSAWIVDKQKYQWVDVAPPVSSDTWLLNFRLDEEGGLAGNITLSCNGYSAVSERSDLEDHPTGDAFRKKLTGRFPDVSMDSLRFENADDLSKPLKVLVDCQLPNAATVAGDFIYLQPALLSDFLKNPFKIEQRTFPVDFPYPLKENVVLNVTIPDGYAVEALPEAVKMALENDGGRFQFNVSKTGNKLQFISNLQLNRLHFEPEEYAALRTFFGMVEEKMGEQVVLKKG
jgi:transglutaminase-like putative cysteine protease